MRKGMRTVHRLCLCGCGIEILPKIGKNGRVECYPKYIAGHGTKHWAQRMKENTVLTPCRIHAAIRSFLGALSSRMDIYKLSVLILFGVTNIALWPVFQTTILDKSITSMASLLTIGQRTLLH